MSLTCIILPVAVDGRISWSNVHVLLLYLLSLQNWTKLNNSKKGPWPEEREWHSACCLNYGQQHPQLLVTGGESKRGKILGDAWILDVDSGRWREVRRKYTCSCTIHCITITIHLQHIHVHVSTVLLVGLIVTVSDTCTRHSECCNRT